MKNLPYPRNLRKAFSSLDHLKRNSMAISLDVINRNFIPRGLVKVLIFLEELRKILHPQRIWFLIQRRTAESLQSLFDKREIFSIEDQVKVFYL